MVERLINIPMNKTDFQKDLKVIKHVAVTSSYGRVIVTSILKLKVTRKF